MTVKEQAIKSIINRFDFAKVHAVMVLIGHKWQIEGQLQVPNIEKLKTHCTKLLARAYEIQQSVQSGGFTAYCDRREVNLGYELESQVFELEELAK